VGGSRFNQAISQGFGWGCGCLLLILAVVLIAYYAVSH
jgi:hypothetical protein